MRFLILLVPMLSMAAIVPADISEVRSVPVAVTASAEALTVQWPDEADRIWTAEFSLDTEGPLITSISLGGKAVVRNANPQYWATTGRQLETDAGGPVHLAAERSGFPAVARFRGHTRGDSVASRAATRQDTAKWNAD